MRIWGAWGLCEQLRVSGGFVIDLGWKGLCGGGDYVKSREGRAV